MTMGYVCDGPCGRFWTGRRLGAEISFLFLLDDEGEFLPATSAQVCPDCAVSLFHTYGPTGYTNQIENHNENEVPE